jgi:hypothetical protein
MDGSGRFGHMLTWDEVMEGCRKVAKEGHSALRYSVDDLEAAMPQEVRRGGGTVVEALNRVLLPQSARADLEGKIVVVSAHPTVNE